ncbi:MAG: 4Fe-4S binding protein [Lachnospiraceae bacterium]|nr:4Fe-4S binding protein [Lachnospiraceae bacterium]
MIKDIIKKIFERKPVRSLPGLDNKFYCTDECDGCGECVQRCPTGHVKMVDGKPYWPKPCLMCAACYDVCPIGAIRYGKPEQK